MAGVVKRALTVFLCHASGDKPQVRALYKRLVAEGVDAWLDEEKLLPGQDWNDEILRALQESDAIIICLSKTSVSKEGYVQREIKEAINKAEEKPSGTIFVIPSRLDDCEIPNYLKQWQGVDLFEEYGFIRLLRSLKRRANDVGATVEPEEYENADGESERRLNQLYTEGLAAFYTEDWDRAYQRFQTILSERPGHKAAAEKLAAAEQQRDLAKLYTRADDAVKAEDWPGAIRWLEELVQKSADYKDAAQLLKDARKQKQLGELYAEASALHAAEKWQAVLKVFQQIVTIEPSYPDPEGLLPSAQKEAAELKRLADLNELYSRGIHKMDAGEWYEARNLLEQVHKAQAGFLDTERLLRKVENEVLKVEEGRKRQAQVQVLYEQARKLSRAGQWGKALTQIEEILKLDKQFVDTDGIAERAKTELESEELIAQRRMEAAALYAEAVGLLDAKKYQEALEKWNEVQAIDPKYKDTARVRIVARRKLDELSQSEVTGQPWSKSVSGWLRGEANISADREMRIEKLLLLSFVVAAIIHELWFRALGWFHILEWESVNVHVLRFVVSALEGGPYGAVVAFALSRTIYNWQLKHSLTFIVGWALVFGVFWLSGGFFDVNSIAALSFSGLATAVVIKWSKPTTSLLSLIIILVGWTLAWWVGQTLGSHLSSIYAVDSYTVGNALSILLGLLFTFGIQVERAWDVLETAFYSALGFALGNYILDAAGPMFLPPTNFGLEFLLWGLIGGAILEVPSRNSRRMLFSALRCGIGLQLGYLATLTIIPVLTGQTYSDQFPVQFAVLRNIALGIGLGLALGLPIRRASAIAVLSVLGVGIYMFTKPDVLFSADYFIASSIPDAVRGALIGLVLGLAYGLMRKAGSMIVEDNRESTVHKISFPRWLRRPVVAWSILAILVVLLWGIPVKSYVSGNQNVYLYSQPQHASPHSGFHGVEGSVYYLCRYDLDTRRYLIADSFWDCLRGETRGWANVENFRARIWNLIVHKQL